MKKPTVKCKFCNKEFDRDKEEWVKISNRYAHSSCYEASLEEKKDYRKLTDFIRDIYSPTQPNWTLIGRQLQTYKDSGKTWLGMYHSLVYFFVIQNHDIRKSQGVGIIPYVYNKAEAYYKNSEDTFAKASQITSANKLDIIQNENIITIKKEKPKKRLIDFNYGE